MDNNNKYQKPKAELPVGAGELPERGPYSPCLPRVKSPKCLLPSSEESSSKRTKELAKSLVKKEAPGTSSKVEGTSVKTGPEVYLRLRPVDRRPASYSISADGKFLVTQNKSNRMENRYAFTAIFDASADQCHIYDACVGPKICAEESVTIMTYGTSGSGKTFTLLGDDQSAGIIPRALCNIFALRKDNVHTWPAMKVVNGCLAQLQYAAARNELEVRRKLLSLCPDIAQGLERKIEEDHAFSTKTCDFSEGAIIYVSFVEIYNELVHDLLEVPSNLVHEAPRTNLTLLWNNGEVYVQGLTSVLVQSSAEALRLLRLGRQRSTSAATEVNSNSSRSHRLFIVDLIKCDRLGFTAHTFKFCDLAGSERVKSTGTTGQRLKETRSINTSLMTLGRCLKAASTGQKIIPHRESKLTMLIKGALLGKERLAIVVTVSPVDQFIEENKMVLNFASIAKNIEFKAPVRKQHHTSPANVLKLAKMAADKEEDRENALLLEAKNTSLKLELFSVKQRLEEQEKMWTDERERLRSRITDLEATQEIEESQSGNVPAARFNAWHCLIS